VSLLGKIQHIMDSPRNIFIKAKMVCIACGKKLEEDDNAWQVVIPITHLGGEVVVTPSQGVIPNAVAKPPMFTFCVCKGCIGAHKGKVETFIKDEYQIVLDELTKNTVSN